MYRIAMLTALIVAVESDGCPCGGRFRSRGTVIVTSVPENVPAPSNGKTESTTKETTKEATKEKTAKKMTTAVVGPEYKISADLKKVIDAQDSKAEAVKYLGDKSIPIAEREKFAKELMDKFGPVSVPKDLQEMIDKSPQKKEINDYLNLLSVSRAERTQFMNQVRKDLSAPKDEPKKEEKKKDEEKKKAPSDN